MPALASLPSCPLFFLIPPECIGCRSVPKADIFVPPSTQSLKRSIFIVPTTDTIDTTLPSES